MNLLSLLPLNMTRIDGENPEGTRFLVGTQRSNEWPHSPGFFGDMSFLKHDFQW